MPTLCDFAGIEPPPCPQALSLRPLLEGRTAPWREVLVTDHHCLPDRSASAGHAVRTERFKYVSYANDPVEQLFDMKADPWETRNLYQDPKYADVVRTHRKLLERWQAQLEPVPPTRDFSRPRKGKRS
jgi:choline-sulfatase